MTPGSRTAFRNPTNADSLPSLLGTPLLLLRKWNRLARQFRFDSNSLNARTQGIESEKTAPIKPPVKQVADQSAIAFSARYEASNRRKTEWCDLLDGDNPGIG